MAMDIKTYLHRYNVSQNDAAEMWGCSQAMISSIACGKARAGWRLAAQIHEATNGEVSKHELRPDIYGPEDAVA